MLTRAARAACRARRAPQAKEDAASFKKSAEQMQQLILISTSATKAAKLSGSAEMSRKLQKNLLAASSGQR